MAKASDSRLLPFSVYPGNVRSGVNNNGPCDSSALFDHLVSTREERWRQIVCPC